LLLAASGCCWPFPGQSTAPRLQIILAYGCGWAAGCRLCLVLGTLNGMAVSSSTLPVTSPRSDNCKTIVMNYYLCPNTWIKKQNKKLVSRVLIQIY
jgi:hypothetical protein